MRQRTIVRRIRRAYLDYLEVHPPFVRQRTDAALASSHLDVGSPQDQKGPSAPSMRGARSEGQFSAAPMAIAVSDGKRASMKHSASLRTSSQPVFAQDLRQDHDRVRRLLDGFATGATAIDRRDAMRLAIDLFEVHTALEDKFYITGVGGGPYQAIMGMMEQLELTDPASQLYTARGIELKDAIEAYMAAEERIGLPARSGSEGTAELSDLPGRRHKLIAEAQSMLRVS
jgi:hypothetical protein